MKNIYMKYLKWLAFGVVFIAIISQIFKSLDLNIIGPNGLYIYLFYSGILTGAISKEMEFAQKKTPTS